MVTASQDKSAVLNALREGASDFFEKPLEMAAVVLSVKKNLHEAESDQAARSKIFQLEGRTQRVEGSLEDRLWYVSRGRSMERVNECLTALRREAMRGGSEEPAVMIYGGMGVGTRGDRPNDPFRISKRKRPWITLNCSQYTEEVFSAAGNYRTNFSEPGSGKRNFWT